MVFLLRQGFHNDNHYYMRLMFFTLLTGCGVGLQPLVLTESSPNGTFQVTPEENLIFGEQVVNQDSIKEFTISTDNRVAIVAIEIEENHSKTFRLPWDSREDSESDDAIPHPLPLILDSEADQRPFSVKVYFKPRDSSTYSAFAVIESDAGEVYELYLTGSGHSASP